MVVTSLTTPITKVARFIGRKKTAMKKKINFSAVNDETESNLFNAVTESLSDCTLNEHSNSHLTEKLISAIRDSALNKKPIRSTN